MNEKIKKLNEEIDDLKKVLADKTERLNYVYKYLDDEENQYEIDGYYTMMQQKELLAHDIKILSVRLEKLTRIHKRLTEKTDRKIDIIKSKLEKAKEEKNELEFEYSNRYSTIPDSHLVYNPNVNQKKYDRKKKKIEKVDKLIVLLTKKLEDENNNITQK